MSRSCDDTLVQLYAEGGLLPAERLVVGAHIRNCPVCAQRLLAYKSLLWDLSHPEPETEPLPAKALEAMTDQLTAAWQREAAGRMPARTPGRVAWDYSTVGLRSSPVGTASASVLDWMLPAVREAGPTLGRTVVWAGRVGRLLTGKGVKRR